MNKEKIYFITGLISLFLGILTISFLPLYFKNAEIFVQYKTLETSQILFFISSVICFFASEKYYKFQICTIILLIYFFIIYSK